MLVYRPDFWIPKGRSVFFVFVFCEQDICLALMPIRGFSSCAVALAVGERLASQDRRIRCPSALQSIALSAASILGNLAGREKAWRAYSQSSRRG